MIALAENSIQLVPDGTLLFHLVLVVVMVVLLNRTLLKPINKVLEERERRTGGKLSEAQEILASAEEKARLWERGLREARNDAYHLLEKERAEALRDREQRLATLKAELGDLVATEKLEIQRQEKAAHGELQAEARRLAELIGTKVLGRPLRG
jgi:F-type H+-transporting ATPase subunit b